MGIESKYSATYQNDEYMLRKQCLRNRTMRWLFIHVHTRHEIVERCNKQILDSSQSIVYFSLIVFLYERPSTISAHASCSQI